MHIIMWILLGQNINNNTDNNNNTNNNCGILRVPDPHFENYFLERQPMGCICS